VSADDTRTRADDTRTRADDTRTRADNPRTRGVVEEPSGLLYRPDVVSAQLEAELLGVLAELRFDPIVIRGQAARRTARHYGLDYDYESRTPKPGEPVPDWLDAPRAVAAELAGVQPDELVEILVQRYPPGSTIGWHRDAPAFGTVVGLSLGGSSRLRFQRGKGDARRVYEVLLEQRSGYVLTDKARTAWQHSIPPTKELRYSITFRTLRRRN
jgi:alkylated DNA repair dioxygenase AlkB